jgi:putative phosphoesterase
MRVGIVSDTHGKHETVQRVVRLLRQLKVECVLHCGDIDDPETVQLFSDFPTNYVFGNCDTDRQALQAAMEQSGATLHDGFGSLDIGKYRIAWTHGDNSRLFRDVQGSEHFDYLFYGHTHVAESHQVGPTMVVNPGALHRARIKTFMVLDTGSGALQSVTVA